MCRSSGWEQMVPPPGSKGIGDRVFGRYGVATVVMQILLMVGGFDVLPLSAGRIRMLRWE